MLLEIEAIRAGYDGVDAVAGASLGVERGEVVGLLGANGSGKSTLLKAALGLLPLRGGSARLFGTPIGAFREWGRLGYVPQRSGADGGAPATVTEVVAVGLLAGQGRLGGALAALRPLVPRLARGDRRAVAAALEGLELGALAARPVAALSGGQQQRVLIARALVGAPELLLLDEPTVGVDAASQRALAGALAVRAAEGSGILLVTHEMGILAPLITRTVVMREGRVVYDGPPTRDLHHHSDPHHVEQAHPSSLPDPLRGGA